MTSTPRAIRWVLAAVASVVAGLAAPARGDDFWAGEGHPVLVSPADLVRELSAAGSAVPAGDVLEAWERYLLRWDEACARLLREFPPSEFRRSSSMDLPMLGDAALEVADRRRRDAVREAERKLFASLFDDIDPSGTDSGTAGVRSLRRMRALQEAALGFDWSSDGLGAHTPESLVVRAFGDDPSQCRSALAALEPSRAARVALGERAVKESEGGAEARRSALREAGIEGVTRGQYMEAVMAMRAAEVDSGGVSKGAGDEAGGAQDPAAPAPSVDVTLAEKGRAWNEAIRRAYVLGRMVGAPERCDLARAQWKAFRDLHESLEGRAKWSLFCEYLRACVTDDGDRGWVRGTELLQMAANAASGAECHRCVREAIERWRSELPGRVFAVADRVVEQRRASLPRSADEAMQRESEAGSGVGDVLAEFAEELRVRCASNCPSDDELGEAEPDWSLVADVPEGAVLAREVEDAKEAAERPEAQDPFADDWEQARRQAADSRPIGREWLLRVLRQVAASPVDEAAIVSLVDAYVERWDDRVMKAEQRVDELASQLPWTPDGFDAKVEAARAEAARERDAVDAELLDASLAIVGALPADAGLVRLARELGDARFESGSDFLSGLRVNPAEVVLAAELPAADRAAAHEAVAARVPAMREALHAARDAFARLGLAQRTLWSGDEEGDYQARVEEGDYQARVARNKERGAAVSALESRWREAQRAARSAFGSALQSSCAAIDAIDAVDSGAGKHGSAVRAVAERREYPDQYRPEEEIRSLAARLLESVPAEDLALRETIAAAADRARTVAEDGRRAGVASRRSLGTAAIDWSGESGYVAFVTVAASTARMPAVLALAAERLRSAAPRALRDECSAWRWFCMRNQVNPVDPGVRLDSAP